MADPSMDEEILGANDSLQGINSQLTDANAYQQQAVQQRDTDVANFDPMGAAGPQPTFNETTPQDHMQDQMKAAPLMMALGAIGGAFGKAHGIAMLASTNAMMKGLVQGNADAYQAAREKYDQAYADYREKSKTWLDVYKAYATAYKGRIDADQKAVQGANAAVGNFEKEARMTKGQIAQMIAIKKSLEVKNAEIQSKSAKEVTDMMRAEAAKSNAASSAQRANTGAAAETRKQQTAANTNSSNNSDIQDTVNLGNELIQDLQKGGGVAGVTGIGGAVSRGAEFVGSTVNPDMSTPATDVKTKANLFTEKVTAAMKTKGQRMDAGDRKLIRDAIDFINERGVSGAQARSKIREVIRVLQKQSGPDEETKVIDGTTYKKVNGQWYRQ